MLGFVDLAHATAAEQPDDAIGAELAAWLKLNAAVVRRHDSARRVITK